MCDRQIHWFSRTFTDEVNDTDVLLDRTGVPSSNRSAKRHLRGVNVRHWARPCSAGRHGWGWAVRVEKFSRL